MEQNNGFQFEVEQQYENEKGVFTVLSIHKTDMLIRWESGEEIRTDIELQLNIQARREWEKEQKEKEALAAKSGRKSGSARAAASFEGLKETDFKNSASGTNWRGRNQLGGAVTHHLPESRYNINSWAFANKPEMHWLDTDHHKRKSGDSRAKCFVRLNTESMFIGFSVGQRLKDDETTNNWDAFIEWLGFDESDETIHQIAFNNGLAIWEKDDPQGTSLQPVKEGWEKGDGKKKQKIVKLADYINELAKDGGVTLEIAKVMTKEEAVAAGKEIAKIAAELFSQLMRLYQAVVKRV